jgi:Reverse transcriptase (RNA-dependent DNA polymerase)
LSIDIDNAYLHGEIDVKVYMTQPPGYIDPRYPNHVCKLLKGLYIYLSLHIDDFLCVGTETNCQSTKAMLKKQFKLKSTKDIVHLGIKISHKPDGTLQISQKHYVNTLLDHFNVGQIRERHVPIAQGVAEALLSEAMKSLSILSHKEHALYRSIVGKLIYAMVRT